MMLTKARKTEIEVAMMRGNLLFIKTDEEAEKVLDYILSAVNSNPFGSPVKGKEVIRESRQYLDQPYGIAAISTTSLFGMRCINIIFKEEDGTEPDYTDDMGVFCYVYNADVPHNSELGYSFFEKRPNGTLHRIA